MSRLYVVIADTESSRVTLAGVLQASYDTAPAAIRCAVELACIDSEFGFAASVAVDGLGERRLIWNCGDACPWMWWPPPGTHRDHLFSYAPSAVGDDR